VARYQDDLALGARLSQRYRLEQLVGSGGTSQVWRAFDEVLGRDVALKVLAPPLAADPVLRSLTRREARAVARIAHPNVTQVFDYGEVTLARGVVVPYLVMEFIEGENLADVLRAGPLAWPDAVRVCAEVAGALAAAHRLGVVHRDVKPGNVMLTPTGAKVVDFGIAAVELGLHPDNDVVAGTPAYVAPEVFGRAAPTAASDVYALGALLFETVTGRPTLDAESLAEARRAHDEGWAVAALDVPGLPEDVRQLCERCLARSPERRPTSAEAVLILEAAAGGRRGGTGIPGPARPAGVGVPAAAAGPPGVAAEPSGVSGRAGIGRASVAARGAAASSAVSPNQTLFDPAFVSPGASQPADSPEWTEGALVAPAGWVGRLRHRPGALGVALAAALAALLGLVLIGAAAIMGDKPSGTAAPGGTSGTGAVAAQPSPTRPPQPDSPAATLVAIEARIAEALTSGRIDADTARDLAGDVADLRERLDRGRLKDLQRRADDLRGKLEQRAEDKKLDPQLAAQLDDLLSRLLQLT